jgi:hypothetical protein
MEKEQEIGKLTRILHGIARPDRFTPWREPSADAIKFNISQFNKVLTRLVELEPGVAPLFAPLPEHATMEMSRMAAHDLASYFSDEPIEHEGRHHGFRFKGCGPRIFVGAMPAGFGRRC